MSKSEVIRALCINLKARWFWTLNWKQIWEVNKCDLDKLEKIRILYIHKASKYT
jgi:hypothetical protein